jgi:uncharacterized membrane protein
MEPLIAWFMSRLAVAIDFVSGLLIAFAVVETSVRTGWLYLVGVGGRRGLDETSRLRLGKWLSLALELALASDIVRTAVAPNWDDIGKLAAIMALRTILNYFLERELPRRQELPAEGMRAAA